jgi:hypothetical protein
MGDAAFDHASKMLKIDSGVPKEASMGVSLVGRLFQELAK